MLGDFALGSGPAMSPVHGNGTEAWTPERCLWKWEPAGGQLCVVSSLFLAVAVQDAPLSLATPTQDTQHLCVAVRSGGSQYTPKPPDSSQGCSESLSGELQKLIEVIYAKLLR